tara:strand:- start:1170 stop:2375 length:1206 start_codon:yes stop_codon:yes gene_type:complete
MKLRKKCLSCKSIKLKEIINLGYHSFADRFIKKKNFKQKDPIYPLIIDYCTKCNFIQSRVITNPKDRYSSIDYSYTSSNSDYSKNHWKNYAELLDKKFDLSGKKILEIGSNDGFLCELIENKGAKAIGVDASKLMTKLSKKKSIKSINSIFNFKESKKIKKKFGLFDLIIANNVFNHSDNPSDFLKGVFNLLKDKGLYIFEQPDFAVGAVSLKFDQIYHEHISYFTSKNINSILNYNNFKLINISRNNYHGGSLRSFAAKKKSSLWKKKFNLKKFKNYPKIYNLKFYKNMMKKIDYKKTSLLKKLYNLSKNGYTICGVGAAAKSNTFLTYYSLNSNIVKFITDASKFKKNKFTPHTRIPIMDDLEIKKYKKIACIILSWNISNLVIKKIKKLNKKVKILYT